MIRQQLVYLIGPITGLDYNGAQDWRDGVKAELEATGTYHCITPMRGKDHLKQFEGALTACIPEGASRPGCNDHDILKRDCYDVHRSDVLFCNLLGAKTVSLGSMWEMAWAYRAQNYSICVMEPGNVHEHIFTNEGCSIRFYTVEEAVAWVKDVLNA